jgi:hypothetical protein
MPEPDLQCSPKGAGPIAEQPSFVSRCAFVLFEQNNLAVTHYGDVIDVLNRDRHVASAGMSEVVESTIQLQNVTCGLCRRSVISS